MSNFTSNDYRWGRGVCIYITFLRIESFTTKLILNSYVLYPEVGVGLPQETHSFLYHSVQTTLVPQTIETAFLIGVPCKILAMEFNSRRNVGCRSLILCFTFKMFSSSRARSSRRHVSGLTAHLPAASFVLRHHAGQRVTEEHNIQY